MSDLTAKSGLQDSREASTGLLARFCAAVSFGLCYKPALPLSSVPPPAAVAEAVVAVPEVAAVVPEAVVAEVAAAVVPEDAAAVVPEVAAVVVPEADVVLSPSPPSEDDLITSPEAESPLSE